MNVTQEQIEAVCGEAKAQGLRSLVHAHDPAVDHRVGQGRLQSRSSTARIADDAAIKAMKDANVFFDPNIGLVLQNYIENKDKYMGSGNFNEEGFAFMEKAVPTLPPVFDKALDGRRCACRWAPTPSPARTDRTRARSSRACRRRPDSRWTRIIGATSLAAESLGLGETDRHARGRLRGRHHRGRRATRLKDITALKNVTFVMRAGTVYKK